MVVSILLHYTTQEDISQIIVTINVENIQYLSFPLRPFPLVWIRRGVFSEDVVVLHTERGVASFATWRVFFFLFCFKLEELLSITSDQTTPARSSESADQMSAWLFVWCIVFCCKYLHFHPGVS